ncbi:ACR3 family arsenite efflux transporter [Lishizhenia sp.]|uniref:ACR3 family arsenite efflux transporter n=1 Tax=Lishizhenia sp. TaxID=2497594 RepID=UPI00299DA927|nr:ACR3 family arsenite efflux transporter [Lishizhenia sp.]MDX1445404.1 ACR3 family arsenite efflux transporter [Lishizhenia sp.]
MEAKIGFFEKNLTLWVAICIVAGVTLGHFFQDAITPIAEFNISTVNIPVAILVWLMIYPMMVQIDFAQLGRVNEHVRGLGLTATVNWLIKPISMALVSYFFFHIVFNNWLSPELANEYLAGAILLGAAPCTAMVFVWSYLTKGNANYTLVQVALNDLILLVLFIPIVSFLFYLFGIEFTNTEGQALDIPYDALFSSVFIFVVLPLTAGYFSHKRLIKKRGKEWFENKFLKALKPLSIVALLATLVLIFAFQGDKIVNDPFAILLIAVPLAIQTYFIFFASWFTGKFLKLPHQICAPSALIGSSNFFELAVAVAISIFGLNSGATLATVVGVLIEVPVMLSLVRIANKHKY